MSGEIRVTVGGDTEPGTPARDCVTTAGDAGALAQPSSLIPFRGDRVRASPAVPARRMEVDVPEIRLIKNPSVVCTEMEDGGVLLDLDTTSYYSLNSTGLEIWNLMDQYPTVEAIARQLTVQYEVDLAHATESTERVVGNLVRENLVHEDLVHDEAR